ncbi:MAG TPA: BatD family protein [Bacteroidales bacterium]|nr:BatD family protein [Bacteroidales bacterium]
MAKTMLWLFAAWLMLGAGSVRADEVKFTATAKPVVTAGERFQLNYKINAEGANFRGPNITDFQMLSGPNTSTSSSVQIVNGQVSRKSEYVFSYILQAVTDGTFTIPPATIVVDGKSYTSNSIQVKVTKNAAAQQGSGQQKSGEATTSTDDLFLRAQISNSTPYQGEQVVITYKLYTSLPISNINTSEINSFPGFWSKDLFQNIKEYPQSREVINGQEFVVAEVKKLALFPQRSGQIVIEPGMLECVAQIRSASRRNSSDPFFDSFFNDPFFNSRYQNVEKKLTSNSLKIDVKPLPTQNKPADFSGAVGSFTFESELTSGEVKTNEPVTLRFKLKGRGNIELIDAPKVAFPPDFEVYDPEISNNIQVNLSGVSGTRTFEYLIIPRNPGSYTIKSVPFSYFDVSSQKYVSLNTPPYDISVSKGDGQTTQINYQGGTNQTDIQYIGRDIRHIKLPPYQLRPIGTYFFRSSLYNLLMLAIAIISIVILIVWRRTVRRRSDVAMMRTRKATKVSRRRLKLAATYLKEKKEIVFYNEISRALWGYMSDKLNIPPAELSMDNVREILSRRNVNPEIADQFIETLNSTEYARFAPGEKSEVMDKVYHEALDVITKIERELK